MTIGNAPNPAFRPISLKFVDPDLESRYVDELAGPGLKRFKSGTIAGGLLWLVGGVLCQVVLGIDPKVAYVLGVGLALVNLVAYLLARRLGGYNQQQIIGVIANLTATAAFFWLADLSGTFHLYGALGAMLIATFSFMVIQLRFVASLGIAVAFGALFIVVSLALDSEGTLIQTVIVGAALIMGTVGVRNLELSARMRFVQRLEIGSLHAEVERLLRTYLSPDVAEEVLANRTAADLGGQVEVVTVVFADLEGFTAMSHATEPAEVARLLNRYFELVVPTVIDEGGSVLSFGGDAILAVFNAPKPCPDHAFRASRAACRIQEDIAYLRSRPGFEQAPAFRIGVNTGEALVGNIGSDATRTFTVIGDTVNLASRLQTHADPGSILIGPATHALVADRAETRELGQVMLKGLSEPIPLCQLVGVGSSVESA